MFPLRSAGEIVRDNIGSVLERYNRADARGHLSVSTGLSGDYGQVAVFWGYDRVPAGCELRDHPPVPADLVVELPSPNARRWELVAQLRESFTAGVRLVWVADPDDRTVTVYTRPGGGTVLWEDDAVSGGDILLGFTCPVAEFFRGVPATE